MVLLLNGLTARKCGGWKINVIDPMDLLLSGLTAQKNGV
jgi:hypothetical protein